MIICKYQITSPSFSYNSKILLKNKVLIYKTIIRPVWFNGTEIWDPTKPSNIRPIQLFQSIKLRILTRTPWYVSNLALQNDLKLKIITELSQIMYKRFYQNFNTYLYTIHQHVP